MDTKQRIEQALIAALAATDASSGPPRLAAAMRYAVFPSGARVRPRLCIAVAMACDEDSTAVTDSAAAAIEFLHCASLVHDDLPCFDDADTRRGKPSVHRAFGERLAVLAGDALIVHAFDTLSRGTRGAPHRLPGLVSIIARAVGVPGGLCAGQAWECEPSAPLEEYQRAKTGALFSAATMAGACAAGSEPGPWRLFGEMLGLAYQVADDICDVFADPKDLGKPVGQDAAFGRPNSVAALGMAGAKLQFDRLIEGAAASIPICAGAAQLQALLAYEARRLIPKGFDLRAA